MIKKRFLPIILICALISCSLKAVLQHDDIQELSQLDKHLGMLVNYNAKLCTSISALEHAIMRYKIALGITCGALVYHNWQTISELLDTLSTKITALLKKTKKKKRVTNAQ